MYQCNPTRRSLYQQFLNGVMTLQTLLVASTSLWNTSTVFNCIRYGQQCPGNSKLPALGLLLIILSKWRLLISKLTAVYILTTLTLILHSSSLLQVAMLLDLIVELPTGIAMFANRDFTTHRSPTEGHVSIRISFYLAVIFFQLINYCRVWSCSILLRAS